MVDFYWLFYWLIVQRAIPLAGAAPQGAHELEGHDVAVQNSQIDPAATHPLPYEKKSLYGRLNVFCGVFSQPALKRMEVK